MRPTKIYWLLDKRTGVPFYCGKTTWSIAKRLANHFKTATRFPSRKISIALLSCGRENVEACLKETVPVWEDWQPRERHWIAVLRAANKDAANTCSGGGGAPGVTLTKEQRESRRRAHLGKTHSPETRAKQSLAKRGLKLRLGTKWSDESRARRSLAQLGKRRTPESIEKSRIGKTGHRHRPESIALMRFAKMGNKANVGRKVSQETRDKIRAKLLGRKHSPERCAAISVAKRAKTLCE